MQQIEDYGVPFLLGAERDAVRALHKRYGKKVYVLDDDCPLGVLILPYAEFLRVPGMNPDVALLVLEKTSEGLDDGVPVLSATPRYRSVLSAITPAAESVAIVNKDGV